MSRPSGRAGEHGDPVADEWERLRRILSLEQRNGYRDRAVIGGLHRYLAQLQMRLADAPLAARDRAARLCALLADYGDCLPGQRVRLLEDAEALLRTAPDAVAARPLASAALAERPAAQQGPRSNPTPLAAAPPNAIVAPEPGLERPRRKPDPKLPAPDRPLVEVPGVGPGRQRLLARLGLQCVGDLLWHFPSRHLDYPPPARATDLFFQQRASYVGQVRRVEVHRTARGLQRITAVLGDATGEVEAVWFRAGFGMRLTPGQRIAVSGDLVLNGRRPLLENPDWEPAEQPPLHTRGLVPVYPITKGIHQGWLRELIARAVDRWCDDVVEILPDWLLSDERLAARREALRSLHYPADAEAAARARRRFEFDDLFLLQVAVLRRRRAAREVAATPLPTPTALLAAFHVALPFALTDAQERVIAEIAADLARPSPMTRLLQGEVGSGKTVVAAAAALIAIAAGGQVALMAPTEILAEQHFRTVRDLFGRADAALGEMLGQPPRVALLTGRLPARERRAVRAAIAAGDVDLVVGTQAVIQDGVEFRDLVLAIADEQHRFGVRQRVALREKGLDPSAGPGRQPHLLVMTATPIPRTLALTVYGDLDLSRLDALPPGRQPIRTILLRPGERTHAYEHLRRQVALGRQGYVICPLVEDSPHLEARAAIEEYARLQRSELAGLRLGLVHGRLRSDEKEAVMAAFHGGDVDVLVATAVVEVGVDVPNATVMLIEGAERFGLAQLHQFRGRIGRGQHAATCALVTQSTAPEVLERLEVVVQSTDGLALAEADLRLRGPGDYYGLRQSGLPDLQVATLSDTELVERARRAAEHLLARDPSLAAAEHGALRAAVEARSAHVGDPS